MKNKLRKLLNKQAWEAGLFWSWNLIFLAFMFLGFAPTVLPEMIQAARAEDIPAPFLIYAGVLTLIPAIAVAMGFIWLRREADDLFAVGYGVEGPLMLILAVRFFIVRQSTPAVTLILAVAGLGALTFLWHILDKKIEQRGGTAVHLQFIGLTLLLLVGLYVSVWILFYIIPFFGFLGEILRDIGQSISYAIKNWDWQEIEWRMVPFFILYFPLLAYTATLFVLMPIAVSVLYTRAWQQKAQMLATRYRWTRVVAIGAAVILLLAFLLFQTDKQPQSEAFALLETSPASLADAQALLDNEEAIRDGLLNAYLAPNRYVSAQGEMDHIKWMYTDAFDITEDQAQTVQRVYEGVARPILYKPVNPPEDGGNRWENRVFMSEPAEAAELYEQYFDEPIVDGEREEVIDAVRSTWMVDQARANWQAVDDREILLTQQEVNIVEHGDWAEVELYEVYQNMTWQRQEVVYYFSLPETAVITGIWLNDSEERDSRFPYRVAPRGAAQAVYQSQVQRRIDPALVEQIGPSQYRFRIFPVEPMRWDWDGGNRRSEQIDGPPMHMWLTYNVMADGDGWPLPYLAEKRNVYWNDNTIRLINGAEMASVDESIWLPGQVTAVTPPQPTTHLVTFNSQTVIAEPVTDASAPAPNGDLRLAVILDRSRSMEKLAKEVETALSELAAWGTADVYLTASELRGEEPSRATMAEFDAGDILYFGGQNAAELLTQFNALQQDETYDAILVITDGTGYELDDGELTIPVPNSPVWMVHLDGRFPLGYGDDTLEVIQASGGGAVGSVAEAMTRLLAKDGAIVDGYVWQIEQELALEEKVQDGFAAIAARQLILAQTAQERANLGELATLDALHEIAVAQGIVTPYSSMIVLVTERQHNLLDEAEAQGDRFEREYEEIGETDQQALTVTGVPEPEEWLLIGLAAVMLGWYWRNGRKKPRLA
ncbi:MAG: TIGR02921 family PEP-CTERM protein [Chloroflexi bacterium]|nr:TIGR02921 family PEP-CTERM protein [Chloroflexota bacterium]